MNLIVHEAVSSTGLKFKIKFCQCVGTVGIEITAEVEGDEELPVRESRRHLRTPVGPGEELSEELRLWEVWDSGEQDTHRKAVPCAFQSNI